MNWPEAPCIIALVLGLVLIVTVTLFDLDPNRKGK